MPAMAQKRARYDFNVEHKVWLLDHKSKHLQINAAVLDMYLLEYMEISQKIHTHA